MSGYFMCDTGFTETISIPFDIAKQLKIPDDEHDTQI
jgi:hypothetical protein